MVGHSFCQAWEENGITQWDPGSMLSCSDTNDFTVQYEGEDDTCILTVDELLVDIFRGDLDLGHL